MTGAKFAWSDVVPVCDPQHPEKRAMQNFHFITAEHKEWVEELVEGLKDKLDKKAPEVNATPAVKRVLAEREELEAAREEKAAKKREREEQQLALQGPAKVAKKHDLYTDG